MGRQGSEPAGVVALFHLFDGVDEGSDAVGNLQSATSVSFQKRIYVSIYGISTPVLGLKKLVRDF
jgi:hypothetical protein